MRAERILPDLFLFRDTCNVYVIRDGGMAVAVDFGSGKWMRHLPRLGVKRLERVFLTHHHADQCAGLLQKRSWPFEIHAPAGERPFLDPAENRRLPRPPDSVTWPPSFAPPPRGISAVRFDLNGFSDCFWGRRRLRFVATPGHSRSALTVIADVNGRQVAFCGDTAHAGGTVWEPFHLEWEHWTGQGALAAWEGAVRLANLGNDLLCPSHGPVIRRPAATLRKLAERLMAFYRAKGSICPGEPDRYVDADPLACGAWRLSPHLFRFGVNGLLLLSRSGEALVVDPYTGDLPRLKALLAELHGPRVTAALATHCHADHCDGLSALRRRGARIWLHPWVAKPLRDRHRSLCPYLPMKRVLPDRLLPERGTWRWNEYRFRTAPFPGQTWWHAAFLTEVDGRRILFAGDSFQPPSRWNGTGGFCALNRSRLVEGYGRSARLVLRWRPDWLLCGHNTAWRFHPRHFQKILAWSRSAERAVRALCVNGDLERDYYTPCRRAARSPAATRLRAA